MAVLRVTGKPTEKYELDVVHGILPKDLGAASALLQQASGNLQAQITTSGSQNPHACNEFPKQTTFSSLP